MIDLESADVAIPEFLSVDAVGDWLRIVTENHNRVLGDITLIFCSDDYLLKVNQEYLRHDYYTDIITFDYSNDVVVGGDLFISVDRVVDNAGQMSVTFQNELLRVIVHGVLHLCGFKDKSESDVLSMRKAEDDALMLWN